MTDADLALYIAAEAGDPAAARAALAAGANANMRGGADDDTPLMQAAVRAHREVALLLLARKARVDVRDGHGYTALMHAASGGDAVLVEGLLQAGADPHPHSHGKSTALSLAIQRNQPAVVALLLQAGADPQALPDGNTPLCLAARAGSLASVELLLAAGAKVDAPGALGRDALRWAAESQHEAVVARLVAAGAKPSISIGDAIMARDAASVQAWLAAGGDPNAPIGRHTPLTLAASFPSLEVLDALLRAGADVNARDSRKDAVIHLISAIGQDDPALLERVLAAKPKIDQGDVAGRTALWWAVNRGPLSRVERLLAAKAKPELKKPIGGGQPGILGSAVRRGDPAILARILALQKDPQVLSDAMILAIEANDSNGLNTLLGAGVAPGPRGLVFAAQHGKAEATRALLAAGADPNAPFESWRPLNSACCQDPFRHARPPGDFLAVLDALLAAGADPNSVAGGRSALWEAIHAAVPAPVARLLAGGARLDHTGHAQALHALLCFRGISLVPGADLAATLSLLLAAGLDPLAVDDAGDTGLHAIVGSAPPEPVRLLLERVPATVHARDASGATPLHRAAAPGRRYADNRREQVIAALLAAGADPDARDHAGQTALDRARAEGRRSAIQALGG